MSLSFGTDGVRGVANENLTSEFAVALGRVAGTVLSDAYTGDGRPPCVLGRDTRESGTMFAAALSAGLAAAGVDVFDAGVIPTAGIALLARDTGAAMGAVISASHNPASDNGIKFFGASGQKLGTADEKLIEQLLAEDVEGDTLDIPNAVISAPAGSIGTVVSDQDLGYQYEEILAASVTTPLDGLHVVADTAHGAASKIGPEALRAAGARVDVMFDAPDGLNINDGCGATAPAAVAAAVRDSSADLGLAFDGDADRLIPVDENGRILDGDHVLAMCALDRKAAGTLASNAIVATVMSNVGLRILLAEHGIEIIECAVGDRNVLNAMDERGLNLGGEQSGHVIFRDLAPTGCGLLTALQVCQLVVRSGRSLSELADRMPEFPQRLVNVELVDAAALDAADDFWDAVRAAEADLGERGRVVVRPSGTEPKLRIMVQAETDDDVTRLVDGLVKAAEAAI